MEFAHDAFIIQTLVSKGYITGELKEDFPAANIVDPESRVEELRLEGIEQANRYAATDTVKQAVGTTRLHKIVVVYKGMEMRVCEEILPSQTNDAALIRRAKPPSEGCGLMPMPGY